MKFVVLSCSLNPKSRSRILARHAQAMLKEAGAESDYVDLQDLSLPFAGAKDSWSQPDVAKLSALLEPAQGILMALPVYTYGVNSAAKNVAELCGGAFENKVVGFACSAGGQASYMSVMGFANSLMLDFRTLVIPRFVYATKEAVEGEKIIDEKISERLKELVLELKRVAEALKA